MNHFTDQHYPRLFNTAKGDSAATYDNVFDLPARKNSETDLKEHVERESHHEEVVDDHQARGPHGLLVGHEGGPVLDNQQVQPRDQQHRVRTPHERPVGHAGV